MTTGIMEVKLISAKGLKNSDFFGRMDPYVVIRYRNEELTSSTARGQGSRPVWNEEFKFKVDFPAADDDESDNFQNNYKLSLHIFDRDTCTKDDYLGHSTIYVKELFEVGLAKGKADLVTKKYRVVLNDLRYYGEIQVAVTFTAKGETDRPKHSMEKRIYY